MPCGIFFRLGNPQLTLFLGNADCRFCLRSFQVSFSYLLCEVYDNLVYDDGIHEQSHSGSHGVSPNPSQRKFRPHIRQILPKPHICLSLRLSRGIYPMPTFRFHTILCSHIRFPLAVRCVDSPVISAVVPRLFAFST